MRRRWSGKGALAFALTAAAAVALADAAGAFQQVPDFRQSPFLRVDPEAVVLSERDSRVPCGECHVQEYEVWTGTPHATGFDELHRTERAQDILQTMGLRVTKRQESLCLRCHYTVKAPDLEAIAGVSCESCHGPARDWMSVHNDWGEGVEHPDQESPEHREERVRASVEGGMLRPSGDLYAVAANCYECHTVPHEELVNTGGHVAGTGNFDLVEYAAQIRHNFVHQQWGETGGNREPPQERTRMMFLAGRILAYEYALRGMAEATTEGSYHRSMSRRLTGAYRGLEAVARAVEIPAVVEILNVGKDVDPAPGQRDTFLGAADRVREIARGITASRDGSQLAALDAVISGQAPAVAEEPAPPEGPEAGGGEPRAGDTSTAAPAGEADAGETREAAGGGTGGPPPVPELPGSVRSRPDWFPDPGPYQVEDPGCNCHRDAEDWWFEDPHAESYLRLVTQEPRAREIATLYGLSPATMARGDRMCASCHGLVLSAAPSVDLSTGVGCESCHGPSSGFLDPHEDGGNPQLGMRELKNPAVRAANCARCHHISDERLLAAGHPSGSDYDFVAANRTIVHYPDERNVQDGRDDRGEGPYPAVNDAALASAWQAETSRRPIPAVEVVELPEAPRPPATPATTGGATAAPTTTGAGARPRAALSPDAVRPAGGVSEPSTPPRVRPVRRAPPTTRSGPVGIEPLPAMADTLSTEEILLLVKRRLEALYRALGRGG